MESGFTTKSDQLITASLRKCSLGFPGGAVVENLSANAGDTGSSPGLGAKIPHASWTKKQNIKQKQYCNKFNKDLKMVYIKKEKKS